MSDTFSKAQAEFALSDHYDGEVFRNIFPTEEKGLYEVLKWRFTSARGPWPEWVNQEFAPKIPAKLEEGEIASTFINHSTVLVQMQGVNFLTDPIYSKRASPVSFVGPARHKAPGVAFEDLPHIDFVLISHNHYDHLNVPTLKKLKEKFDPWFFIPIGNRATLSSAGITKIVEMDWWNEFLMKGDVRVTLVPAQHWSMRSPLDKNKALWGGYYVQMKNKSIYFAGDTGYSKIFEMIRRKMGPPDLALLPIGSYEPRWFMQLNHMNPEDAVKAHIDLQSKNSMAIHFGTFQLGDEAYNRPEIDLAKALKDLKVDGEKFKAIQEGDTLRVK